MGCFFEDLKFDEKGLIPVVTQDDKTNAVLMVAYMNKEALEKSVETGMAHYWSRSREKLWVKGETSGHYQTIKSVKADCDGDTLLIKVEQKEAACHTGHYSCFYRELKENSFVETSDTAIDPVKADSSGADILQEIYAVAEDRAKNPKEGSYTGYLLQKGVDKICKKVGEEAAEVIIASKNNSRDEISYEVADLFYHIMVLLVDRGISLDEIYGELKGRRSKPGWNGKP